MNLAEEFVEIVSIDSPSLKERKTADFLMAKLRGMGIFDVYEDDAGSKAGGDCGNVIATVKGEQGLPSIALLAHMDTVGPCVGKKCVVEGNIVKSDGRTILGGDDAAGIVIAFEILRRIRESGIRHGDIQVIFTIAEEIGLVGAKNLDYSRINADYAFVFDCSGPIGTIVNCAAMRTHHTITIKGKASHAGIDPEKGVSAIEVFARAVSRMRLGRIDDETTANIGVVNAGVSTNVVCDQLTAKAEIRSTDNKKLDVQVAHMEKCFADACEELGAGLDFTSVVDYRSFAVDKDAFIIKKLAEAADALGHAIALTKSVGGSDANIFNEKGIVTLCIASGMFKVHSTEEYADLSVCEQIARLMCKLLEVLSK